MPYKSNGLIDNALVCAVTGFEPNEAPKQAPEMPLCTGRPQEKIAIGPEGAPYRRASASVILLMTYDSLRFPDALRIASIEIDDDSVRGALLSSKTRIPHGIPWPRAGPRVGVDGSTSWAQPLVDFRRAHFKVNGQEPTSTSPRINRLWEL